MAIVLKVLKANLQCNYFNKYRDVNEPLIDNNYLNNL